MALTPLVDQLFKTLAGLGGLDPVEGRGPVLGLGEDIGAGGGELKFLHGMLTALTKSK